MPKKEWTEKDVIALLRTPVYLPSLNGVATFSRLQDDHDGKGTGRVFLHFASNNDAFFTTDGHFGPAIRFRDPAGGSASPHVYNALRLLAVAVVLDEQRFPNAPHPEESRHGEKKIEIRLTPDRFSELLESGHEIDIFPLDFEGEIHDTLLYREYDPEQNKYLSREIEKYIAGIRRVPEKDLTIVSLHSHYF